MILVFGIPLWILLALVIAWAYKTGKFKKLGA